MIPSPSILIILIIIFIILEAVDRIADTSNLGSLIRSSAAFGIVVVILSEDSCDAWYRRCVRVSMGHVLSVPSVRVLNLASTLVALKEKFGVASYAAVIDKENSELLEEIQKGDIEARWSCVVGNEANGISSEVLNVCKSRIRIDIMNSVDSLSVGVAGGILLHGMAEREGNNNITQVT